MKTRKRIISLIELFIILCLGCQACINKGWDYAKGKLYIFTNEGMYSWIELSKKSEYYIECIEIIIGDSITNIPENAFKGYINLRKLHMGANVICIGDSAFCSCESLLDITWSEALESIGENAFEKTAIVELKLPEKLKKIEDFAFNRCIELESCKLPDSLLWLGCNFTDCNKLREITLPDGLKTIEDYSFSGCNALREVTIPASVEVLGYDAFSESGIERIVIEGSLREIRSFRTSLMPALKQIVFLGDPPKKCDQGDSIQGLQNNNDSDAEIYCLKNNAAFQSLGDTYNGFQLVRINTIQDLPPIDIRSEE